MSYLFVLFFKAIRTGDEPAREEEGDHPLQRFGAVAGLRLGAAGRRAPEVGADVEQLLQQAEDSWTTTTTTTTTTTAINRLSWIDRGRGRDLRRLGRWGC